MQLLDKVSVRSFICGVELAFFANAIPSNIVDWQQFYNSTFENNDFEKAYAGKSTISFLEEGVASPSGTFYKQKVTFRFPVTDKQRADRIALLQQIKFLKIKITSGLDIVIGRNDYFQNTRPVVTPKTNEHFCEVEIAAVSIFPSGFTPNYDAYGLPSLIPVTLY